VRKTKVAIDAAFAGSELTESDVDRLALKAKRRLLREVRKT